MKLITMIFLFSLIACKDGPATLAVKRLGPDANCIGSNPSCSNTNTSVYCNAQGKSWVCDCTGCIVVSTFPVEMK